MKHVWKLLMAALLCLMLLLPVTGAAAEETATVYGVCTADQVRLRKQASTSAAYWFYIDEGFVTEVLDLVTDADGNVTWYKVNSTHPVPNGRTYIGYVHADFYRLMTEAETEAYLAGLPAPEPTEEASDEPTATPEPTEEDAPAIGTGMITADGVNFRAQDNTEAEIYGKLDEGTEVELLTIPETISADHWYCVRYGDQVGYVQSNYIRVLSTEEETTPPEEEETSAPEEEEDDVIVTATGAITAGGVNFRLGPGMDYGTYGKLNAETVVELLTIPSVIDSDHWYKVRYNGQTGYIQAPFIRVLTMDESYLPDESEYGYAKLLEDSVNLRATAGGATVTQWKGKGSLMRIVGDPVPKGYYNWYPVYYGASSAIYYVREDMIEVVMMVDGVVVTPTPEPESPYGYIITTKPGVNLRIQPGDESIAQVPRNTILACVGPAKGPAASGTSYTWYYVRYNGMYGYLRGDCVQVCNADGSTADTTPAPDETPNPSTSTVIYGYIRLIKTGVNLRKEPLKASLTQLPLGLILPVMGETVPAGEKGMYCWYPVRTADGLGGYIRGDCAVPCDAEGNEVEPTPTPTPGGTELTGVTGRLLKHTNFREAPSTNSDIITVIRKDTVVTVLTIPADKVNGWYKIAYDGKTGYVLASLLTVVEDGSGEATPAPTLSLYGYVMINDVNVNLRDAPAGETFRQLDKGTVWPMTGNSVTIGSVIWYPINVNGSHGYVHGDFAFKLSPTQEESYLAGSGVPEETPSPDSVLTSYVVTTYDKVNIRVSYSLDSARAYQVAKGTVMPFSATKKVGTVTWYNIVYKDRALWVHGNYVKVMTQAEYDSWKASDPDAEPDITKNLGYLRLIKNNVYIRNAAAGNTIVDQLPLGTVIRYYAEDIPGGDYKWYRVLTPEGEFGYIRADMVEKCEQDGSDLPTPTPSLGDLSSAPDSQQETDYTDLKLGDSGIRVYNLVSELINQGYYKGSVTSDFTSAVQAAVKAFQSVNGLTVDGIAGDNTQHALFGTKPIGSGDTADLDFKIYPVEKIDWFEGGIQEMIPRGSNFKVYDVKTGIVWWAHRWAGSFHADIETLTAADSARLCEIYGVKNLQQIVDDNLWQRRPCLVTIGTRTFACSLDGMQHGTDTISNNNMDGQICLHFTNSTGHASGAVSTSHAEAIEYAYNNCPAGKKE